MYLIMRIKSWSGWPEFELVTHDKLPKMSKFIILMTPEQSPTLRDKELASDLHILILKTLRKE